MVTNNQRIRQEQNDLEDKNRKIRGLPDRPTNKSSSEAARIGASKSNDPTAQIAAKGGNYVGGPQVPVGASKKFEDLANTVGQGIEGASPPGQAVGPDNSKAHGQNVDAGQAFKAGIGQGATGTGVGAGAGALLAAPTAETAAPVTVPVGAVIGAGVGFTKGFIGNIKKQLKENLNIEVGNADDAVGQLSKTIKATNAGMDPVEATQIFNTQLRKYDESYTTAYKDAHSTLNKFLDVNAREELANFESFNSPGGARELLIIRMHNAVQSPDPSKVDISDFEDFFNQ